MDIDNCVFFLLFFFFRKKDGELRTCFDYWCLNEVITKDAFPWARIGACLDALPGAKYISHLDITSAYNQIPVKDSDVPKQTLSPSMGYSSALP